MTVSKLEHNGNQLAYVHYPARTEVDLPAVMFLGGFKSDMEGTKALYLEAQCRNRGQEFVRFDYSGHGQSDGAFVDGTIGSWSSDAKAILDTVVQSESVILVGSSMGGWIALLLALSCTEKLAGVVGIAAAPDFTRDIKSQMGQAEREMVDQIGRLEIPNDYSDEPYIFTRALLEDGEQCSLLDQVFDITLPIILVQGRDDPDVHWSKAEQIVQAFPHAKTEILFIEDGDHRLSREQDLELIGDSVLRLSSE